MIDDKIFLGRDALLGTIKTIEESNSQTIQLQRNDALKLFRCIQALYDRHDAAIQVVLALRRESSEHALTLEKALKGETL